MVISNIDRNCFNHSHISLLGNVYGDIFLSLRIWPKRTSREDFYRPNNMNNATTSHIEKLGVVAIGRNEGERLIRCLDSLKQHLPDTVPIIYVDSGSTDHSVAEAQARNVSVIELDMSIPFTGARARNAGLNHLMQQHPQTQYVQFIDGDCELLDQWVESAIASLRASPELAVVFGRLHERFPEASPYNQLADIEWDVPVGGGHRLRRHFPHAHRTSHNPRWIQRINDLRRRA